MKLYIIMLIYMHAPLHDIDPELAIAVAKTESSLNHRAVGQVGEVGIFQVRPEYSKYSAPELFDPEVNVKEGIRILSEAKRRCSHQENKQFVICYNTGVKGARGIANPGDFGYYRKVYKTYRESVNAKVR